MSKCKMQDVCPLAKWLTWAVCIFIPVLTGWVSWTNVRLDQSEDRDRVLIRMVEKVDNLDEKVDGLDEDIGKIMNHLLR